MSFDSSFLCNMYTLVSLEVQLHFHLVHLLERFLNNSSFSFFFMWLYQFTCQGFKRVSSRHIHMYVVKPINKEPFYTSNFEYWEIYRHWSSAGNSGYKIDRFELVHCVNSSFISIIIYNHFRFASIAWTFIDRAIHMKSTQLLINNNTYFINLSYYFFFW